MYSGMEKRHVAVFDFDGTLTQRDTLPLFIRFAKGTGAYYAGLAVCSPFLLAYVLRLYPNDKAKQRLFSHFFKGMDYTTFRQLGIDFAQHIDSIACQHAVQRLKEHLLQGKVYVVSASVTEWVEPWCRAQGVCQVLGTQVEVSADGRLTGCFLSRNCYGEEKVRRLLEAEPHRADYYLTAYGDSRGDCEMLAFADTGINVRNSKL